MATDSMSFRFHRCSRILSGGAIAFAALVIPCRALDGPVPRSGPQFQVNEYTTNVQAFPALALDDQGRTVIVWRTFGAPGPLVSPWKIAGRILDASGIPLGPEFVVDQDDACYYVSAAACSRRAPAVGVAPGGDFVVVWSFFEAFSGFELRGRRMQNDGTPFGPEFSVGEDLGVITPADSASVAVDANGDFVVAWIQDVLEFNPEQLELLARRFDGAGNPKGPSFLVTSSTSFPSADPTVVAAPGGEFVVVWQSLGSGGGDDSGTSIQMRRYDAAGVAQGPEVQVNSYTTGVQFRPSVDVADDGRFVVVWESWGSSGTDQSLSSIQAQRFSAAGLPQGPQFQVNETTSQEQGFPAVAVGEDGAFLVAWLNKESVWAQRFDALGSAVGPETRVSHVGGAVGIAPTLGAAPNGGFVVAWSGYEGAGDDYGDSVQARVLVDDSLFFGSFEDGDTAPWSITRP